MRTRLLLSAVLIAGLESDALPQSTAPPEPRTPQPLYRVTIVSRTTKAINYGYLSAPTRIGFQGTPIAPSATGEAVVEPGRGATLLNIRVDHLPPPGQFGAQYLTYVVWAISPDGRAQNVGELILDGADKGKLRTSTPLQTFALIVTTEPYYAVSQPSEVVVLENVITRDTVGKVTEVNATYELLPRKPYTYDPAQQAPAAAGPPVSPAQYESITALYQALNAIQIAQSQGADRHAPDQLARARQLYNKARAFPVHLSKEIVAMAREATQIAEDSRAIAARRNEAEKAADTERSTATEHTSGLTIPAEPSPPAPQPRAPRTRTENRLAAPERERARTETVPQPATEARPPVEVDHKQFLRDHPEAAENRRRLLAALPRTFEVLDSSRGILITIPQHAASSDLARSYFAAIAAAVRPFRNVHLEVESHRNTPDSVGETESEAQRIRQSLISAGMSPDVIVPRGYGNTRPRGPAGSIGNRRIAILISGDDIGTLPAWDRTYTLQPPRPR